VGGEECEVEVRSVEGSVRSVEGRVEGEECGGEGVWEEGGREECGRGGGVWRVGVYQMKKNQ
jgi:hypothetical protein